jgi:hypothetical protein
MTGVEICSSPESPILTPPESRGIDNTLEESIFSFHIPIEII